MAFLTWFKNRILKRKEKKLVEVPNSPPAELPIYRIIELTTLPPDEPDALVGARLRPKE